MKNMLTLAALCSMLLFLSACKDTPTRITLSPKELDFGLYDSIKTLTITKEGPKDVHWKISTADTAYITCTPSSGTNSAVVTVSLNRERCSKEGRNQIDGYMELSANMKLSEGFEGSPLELDSGSNVIGNFYYTANNEPTTVTVSSGHLDFNFDDTVMTLIIRKEGPRDIHWKILIDENPINNKSDTTYIFCTPSSGTNSAVVTISFNREYFRAESFDKREGEIELLGDMNFFGYVSDRIEQISYSARNKCITLSKCRVNREYFTPLPSCCINGEEIPDFTNSLSLKKVARCLGVKLPPTVDKITIFYNVICEARSDGSKANLFIIDDQDSIIAKSPDYSSRRSSCAQVHTFTLGKTYQTSELSLKVSTGDWCSSFQIKDIKK